MVNLFQIDTHINAEFLLQKFRRLPVQTRVLH